MQVKKNLVYRPPGGRSVGRLQHADCMCQCLQLQTDQQNLRTWIDHTFPQGSSLEQTEREIKKKEIQPL